MTAADKEKRINRRCYITVSNYTLNHIIKTQPQERIKCGRKEKQIKRRLGQGKTGRGIDKN
jgi:hypothetical protein